jgi:hypothetical protein
MSSDVEKTAGPAGGAPSAHQQMPPYGWYYYGPGPSPIAPPAAASPNGEAADSSQFKEAFDRLSRGDLSAETISKLLKLDDADFWKGALVGAAVALLATNLPAITRMFSGAEPSSANAAEGTDPE